ncbi:hypothetical protein LSAT2_009435 [Lamellibrachia satsuma]|nr:hypothetical protein LSAT2_009435 [Lamellibrachia satsuma]
MFAYVHLVHIAFALLTCKYGVRAIAQEVIATGEIIVLRGKTFVLPCVANGTNVQAAITNRNYTWRYGEDEVTYDNRHRITKHGSLYMKVVLARDTGSYVCELSGYNDSQKVKQRYIHNVIVALLHRVVSTDRLVYGIMVPCNDTRDRHKVEGARRYLCARKSNCLYSLQYFCRERRLGMNELVLKITNNVISLPNVASCGPQCSDKIALQRTQDTHRLVAAFIEGEKLHFDGVYALDLSRSSEGTTFVCQAGWTDYRNTVCIACPAGKYGRSGSKGCQDCPIGTFQSHYGRSECIECPGDKTTDAEGSVSQQLCVARGPCVSVAWQILQTHKAVLFALLFGCVLALTGCICCIIYCVAKKQSRAQTRKVVEVRVIPVVAVHVIVDVCILEIHTIYFDFAK